MSSSEATPAVHPPWAPRTWGLTLGLLTASLAMLVGVVSGLEPETILLRSVIGGGLTGTLAWVTAWLIGSSEPDLDEEI